MAITWNIDEARRTIREQMAEAARLDATIDDLSAETSAAIARAEAAEQKLRESEQKLREIGVFAIRANTRAEAAEAAFENLSAWTSEAMVKQEAEVAECRAERARYGDMMTVKLAAAEAEIGELKVQIRALQLTATALAPGDGGLVILLARQTIRAEAAEAECERLREQAAALRALIAQAVQADLDDDAFALEAAIVRMADALDDNGQDAR